MSRKHGQTTYYIEGEGFVGEGASSEAGRTLGAALESEVGHFFSAAPESASALNPERPSASRGCSRNWSPSDRRSKT